MRLPALVFAAAVTLGFTRDASARGPAYKLDPQIDVPILLIGGGLTSAFLVLDEAPPAACTTGCERSKINAFDRGAAGNYSEAWGSVGDIATAATVLFGPVLLVLDEGWKKGLNDALVVGEAALLASALQVTISYAVPRARPRVYGNEAPLEDRNDANAGRSFYSGHTANVVAASVAAGVTYHRLGHQKLGWLVLGAGLAGSTFVGIARVMAGSHFPSDVLVGAATGAGLGMLVPYLHASPAQLGPMAGNGTGGLMLSGTW